MAIEGGFGKLASTVKREIAAGIEKSRDVRRRRIARLTELESLIDGDVWLPPGVLSENAPHSTEEGLRHLAHAVEAIASLGALSDGVSFGAAGWECYKNYNSSDSERFGAIRDLSIDVLALVRAFLAFDAVLNSEEAVTEVRTIASEADETEA